MHRTTGILRSILAALFALVVAASTAPPASATPTDILVLHEKPDSDVHTNGVGWHNEVAVDRALYQCPAFHCNQGQAYPGNDLAEVCTLSANGTTWGLVLNRANVHTGFIPINQLIYADPPQSCDNVGYGSGVTSDAALYQCPAFHCNQGQAYPGDDIASLCYWGGGPTYWIWMFNHANGHEGLLPVNGTAGLPSC